MKSILQDEKVCFITERTDWLEEHHIFYGRGLRRLSEKYGLKVYLNHYVHNEAPDGVHYNKEANLTLKRAGQKAFMEHYPDLDFMKIFGKNYL